MDLCHHVHGRILHSAPFLAWMKDFPICVKDLASRVSSRILAKGDYVFRRGEPNEQVFFLSQGHLWLSCNDRIYGSKEDDQTCEQYPWYAIPHRSGSFGSIRKNTLRSHVLSAWQGQSIKLDDS